jgi:hypothetical protein
MRTNDIQKCAVYMAKLHKIIVQNRISNVPSYKGFLKYQNTLLVNLKKQEETLQVINGLPVGCTTQA